MQKSSLALVIIFFVALSGIIGYRFNQSVIHRNYLVDAYAPCDPQSEQCFTQDCTEGDLDCDPTPYKKIEILASEAPACLEEHTCTTFSCTTESCSTTYCSPDTLDDGEKCTSVANDSSE